MKTKKINLTRRNVLVLVVCSIICLFLEPIGYHSIYVNPLEVKWGGIVFTLSCILVLLGGKSYFADQPSSLTKWLYFMIIAFLLKAFGQLAFRVLQYISIILPLYIGATIFFLLALLESIRAYRNLPTSTARKT